MTTIRKFLFALIIVLMVTAPFFVLAQEGGIVPCGTEKWPKGTYSNITGDETSSTKSDKFPYDISNTVKNPCKFGDLLVMVNKLIYYVVFTLMLPLSAIAFAYGGFLLLFSGGNAGKKESAIKIFKNVGLGIMFAAGAWLIVSLLLSILGFEGAWIGFGNVI